MSTVTIRAENLSKKYMISVNKDAQGGSLAERLNDGAKKLLTLQSPFSTQNLVKEELWPVKDVSFEIRAGEVVGIIGRNGAGKSTLLKILSRITEPTSGRAETFGRVGTLLEVGTGFHPELTGRDNIYLSGIILGMKKAEIDRKFDEIVEFAGIAKFIDTPVKRYSSGMYVRLAFAVGAYLEPEILIVDEVLAVGDSAFQKKCLSKMKDIGEHGRTVLFVSHNLQAVTRLCKRVILLDQGQVIADGLTHQVVESYMHAGASSRGAKEWTDLSIAPGGDVARLCAVRVKTIDDRVAGVIDIRQSFAIELEIEVLLPGWVLTPNIQVYSDDGECIFESFDLDPDWRRRPYPVGRYISTAWIPGNLLSEGAHFMNAVCMSFDPHRVLIDAKEVIGFVVVDSHGGDSARGDFMGEMLGVVRPMLKWTTQFVSTQESANITRGVEGRA
ncbi:MAG: polysaccharide ABC transporter ATP-binding protein [Nitrospirota bacterium]